MLRATGLALVLLAAPLAAQETHGLWQTEAAAGRAALTVRIGPCGYDVSLVCGVVEAAPEAAAGLLGQPLLTGMRAAGPGRWSGGQLLVPEEGRVYPGAMALSGDRLTVEGCAALFCRAQVWRRLGEGG